MIAAIIGLMITVGMLIILGVNQWRINCNFIDAMEHMQNQIDVLAERSFRENK